MKRALITGIAGMDGSHLADLLLAKGYEVHGIVRRTSLARHDRLDHLIGTPAGTGLFLHDGDLLDQESLCRAVAAARPDEVYNLAAMSFVGSSWAQPILTSEVTGLGTLRVLEACRSNAPEARIYQASSSEMFGNAPAPQTEEMSFHPRSPYGVAKAFAHHAAVNYRESYGMHISCGILFNHESERRGVEFVTRSITRQVARIVAGMSDRLRLGNLDAARDWGYAPDYVEAMWLMLQRDEPDDYVVATGQARTVREFALAALTAAGCSGASIEIDPALLRPAELSLLRGHASKAKHHLGWEPRTSFEEMIGRMVNYDIAALGMPAAA